MPADPHQRKWVVNGAIRRSDTYRCLDAVDMAKFVLLSGPRASGKSTRLDMLKHRLLELNYEVFSTLQLDLLFLCL